MTSARGEATSTAAIPVPRAERTCDPAPTVFMPRAGERRNTTLPEKRLSTGWWAWVTVLRVNSISGHSAALGARHHRSSEARDRHPGAVEQDCARPGGVR